MRLGIFAKTFAGSSPLVVLQAAATAGYSSVQYNLACSGIDALPKVIATSLAAEVREASVETGVEVAAVSATYNMIHPALAKREAGRRGFATIAASAELMGTRLLTVCSGSGDEQDQWRHHPHNRTEAAWSDMCNEFEFLLDIADRHDLTIGVEPEVANVVSSAELARKLLDSMGSDRIQIVLDAANLFERETADERLRIIEHAVDLLGDRIVMAHAKDRRADGSFTTAGKGVIDYPHYLRTLARVGFDGLLVTHGLAANEAADVAAFLKSQISGASE